MPAYGADKLPMGQRGGGRKPNAINKLTRVRAHELVATGNAPLDLMLKNMKFYEKLSDDLKVRLFAVLDKMMAAPQIDPADIRAMQELTNNHFIARDKSQGCAVDAAPYVHPRLASITHKNIEERREIKMVLEGTFKITERSYREINVRQTDLNGNGSDTSKAAADHLP